MTRPPAPVLRIPPGELARMRGHAEAAFPEEACGLLLGRAEGECVRVLHVAQSAPNERGDERIRRFLITPTTLMQAEVAAEAAGLDVLGFYHSHPGGVPRPSAYDLAHAWPWYSYVVVACAEGRAGEVTSWRLAEDRSAFLPEALVPNP